MLESPVRTESPSFASERTEVMNLRVVPEFSTFTTSAGARGFAPTMRIPSPEAVGRAPIAAQAEVLAFLSLGKRTFVRRDSPPAGRGRRTELLVLILFVGDSSPSLRVA